METSLQDYLNRDWRTYSANDETHHLMSCYTGLAIGEHEGLMQRLVTLLATPKGSRVGMREYGSDLYKLIDRPMNAMFRMEAYAATADAIERWEPLFKLRQVQLIEQSGEGVFQILLDGDSLIDGQAIQIGDIILDVRKEAKNFVSFRDTSWL